MVKTLCILNLVLFTGIAVLSQERSRIRELGITPGVLPTGKWNAITDVEGVMVGHATLIGGDSIRTGVTVILPHGGNIFREKVPAAVSVGNGFGKAIGFTQVIELGNLETPVALTGTLNIFSVADALVDHVLSLPGNEEVRSVNPVAGETNDGWLNDIRGRHVKAEHVLEAITCAVSGPVAEGSVGAGTGTICMGHKGGIGTSSRVLGPEQGGYTVGVLVQTNFGGTLRINGAPVGEALVPRVGEALVPREETAPVPGTGDGSCMIVIATDAPLSARNLERLAKRSFLALGRVGSTMSNGSGDYAIAFSTHPGCRISHTPSMEGRDCPEVHNDLMSPLFLAVVEAAEEAIYNSLFMATDMEGYGGRKITALPIDRTLEILEEHNLRD